MECASSIPRLPLPFSTYSHSLLRGQGCVTNQSLCQLLRGLRQLRWSLTSGKPCTAESTCYMTSWGPAPEVTEEESELGKIPGIYTMQVPQTFWEGRT